MMIAGKRIRGMILGTVLFRLCMPGQAQDMESLFRQGNELYQAGRYQDALQNYQSILENGRESGALYYNMGNCYYKMERIGPAVLNYERARRLMPRDPDLLMNLSLANVAVQDKIESREEFFLLRITRWFTRLLSVNAFTAILAVFYILFMSCLILWIVLRRPFARRLVFRLGWITGILLLITGITLLNRIRMDANNREAVIMQGEVVAMSAPGSDGIEVFTIHEGTKVSLDKESGDWKEIVLADGKVGWVKAEVLEEI